MIVGEVWRGRGYHDPGRQELHTRAVALALAV